MSIGGFYGSLAASASVFIAISSAYLVNKIINSSQRHSQLQDELQHTENRLEGLRARREKHEGRMNELEDRWREQRLEAIYEQVDDFIEDHIGSEYHEPPEIVDFEEIKSEFAVFVQQPVEELADEVDEVLRDRLTEIQLQLSSAAASSFISNNFEDCETSEDALRRFRDHFGITNLLEETQEALKNEYWEHIKPNVSQHGLGGFMKTDIGIPTDPGIIAAERQIEAQQQRHEEQEYRRNWARALRARTEIRIHEQEQERIQRELDSFDNSVIVDTFRANLTAIILSVGSPSVAYLSVAIPGLSLSILPVWLELLIVFGMWVGGLAIVYLDIRESLKTELDLEDESSKYWNWFRSLWL